MSSNTPIYSISKELNIDSNRIILACKSIGINAKGATKRLNEEELERVKHYFETGTHKPPASIKERAEVARRHLEMSVSWKGERLGVYETRRHYSNYFKGIENFKPFRQKLVTTETSKEVYAILDSIAEKFAEYSF